MVRDVPHQLALFSLVPLNDRAWEVLNHPSNAHFVSSFRDGEDANNILYGLDIGLYIGSKSRYTLATIGRCGDIVVEGSTISRIQCSFEIHEGNQKEVMLQDRSTNKSTQFFGETAMPFEEGRCHRRVVVDKKVNLEFGFGGLACNMYQFRIVWHLHSRIAPDFEDQEDNPRQTRTILEEPPTAMSSRSITRIHAPKALEKVRYSKRAKLGDGMSSEVWKIANIDSGEYLAVKRVKRPDLQTREHALLKQEAETLARISHENIIEYKAAQCDDGYFDLIMGLKTGNVQDLINHDLFQREPKMATPFLGQMLRALDYLASKDIIHRDIKPENILYTPLNKGYLYQLADFGVANSVTDAPTVAGTRIYMAPEVESSLEYPQTPKMDVWSLFVTLVYAMDGAGFRAKPLHTTPLRIKAIQEAADDHIFKPLQAMAHTDPNQRATAGDMLDQIFNGEGRTTRCDRARAAPDVACCQEETRPERPKQHLQPEKVIGAAERRFREALGANRVGRSRFANRATSTKYSGATDLDPFEVPKRDMANLRRMRNISRFPEAMPHHQRPRRSERLF